MLLVTSVPLVIFFTSTNHTCSLLSVRYFLVFLDVAYLPWFLLDRLVIAVWGLTSLTSRQNGSQHKCKKSNYDLVTSELSTPALTTETYLSKSEHRQTSNLQSISDAQAEPVAYVVIAVQQQTTDKCNNAADTDSWRRWLVGLLSLTIVT